MVKKTLDGLVSTNTPSEANIVQYFQVSHVRAISNHLLFLGLTINYIHSKNLPVTGSNYTSFADFPRHKTSQAQPIVRTLIQTIGRLDLCHHLTVASSSFGLRINVWPMIYGRIMHPIRKGVNMVSMITSQSDYANFGIRNCHISSIINN